MAKLISLKINDDLFADTERLIKNRKTTRNAYINQALKLMNHFQHRQRLRKILHTESHKISQESKKILKEFEALQDRGIS